MAEKRGGDFRASWVASGDFSAKQFHPVGISTTDQNKIIFAATGAVLAGVLQNKPRNGEHASVVGIGHTKLFIAGSMGAGAEFHGGAAGALLATSGQFGGGFVLHACDSGDIAEAVVLPHRLSAL